MPAKFESGVSQYVHGVALVEVYFPVDNKGTEYCCCEQCYYFRESSRSCAINHETVAFPGRYVGSSCPMMRVSDKQFCDLQELIIKIMEENENK